MQPPLLPSDEAQRLAALRALHILDTPAEPRFDRITRIAAQLFNVPICLVSLVDADRQWFKSCVGLTASETPRDISFCGHAILHPETFVISDALTDPRFADNPLVVGEPNIRFYAGQPLATADGNRIGTLCLIDRKPRQMSAADLQALRDLAQLVEEELNSAQLDQVLTAQREGSSRLRAILDNVVDGIITINARGLIESINPAAERIFGYSPAEVMGQNVKILMPDPYHTEHDEYLQRYINTGQAKVIGIGREVTGKRKDGSLFPMELAVGEMRVNEQRMFTGIVRDITQRKREEESLNRFKNILDNTIDMIFMFDPDTLRFIYLNRGAIERMGYTREELLQMTPTHIKPLLPEPDFRALIAPILSGEKQTLNFETVHRHKDGSEFPVEVFLQLVREDGGKGLFVNIVRDITERKKIERLKSEFVSTVSHELRTPLTSIRGSLGLVAGGVAGALPAQAKSLVDIAYKNCERLISLINDILDIEKIESGQMKLNLLPQSLMPLIEQAIEANRAYGEQYGVTFEIVAALPEIMANTDRDRLMQIMANLLSNAAKFSPPGGRVEVSVKREAGDLLIQVKDHGSGIPDEFRDRIFLKFSQADSSDTRQKGGTGLGLSITKAIVEKMGGTIDFDSQPGSGTTFQVALPEWHQQHPSDLLTALAEDASPPRVLVCEDDHDIALLIGTMLKHAGFAPDFAYSAAQAKALLQTTRYAAMTLDLGLPDQDGSSLIRELRSQEATRNLPVVIVSANAEEGRAQLNGVFAIVDWLTKPIDPTRLVDDVRRAAHSIGGYRARILHVEDDPDIRSIVAGVAKDLADFDFATTLEEARAKLALERYHLIILDIGLPDGSGWELLPALAQINPQPAVLVFSAQDLGSNEAQGVAAALLKSSTSNPQLLAAISSLIRSQTESATS
jgi:PAS domain S-box-containing protein